MHPIPNKPCHEMLVNQRCELQHPAVNATGKAPLADLHLQSVMCCAFGRWSRDTGQHESDRQNQTIEKLITPAAASGAWHRTKLSNCLPAVTTC
jgi:hypothetical protein